MVESINFRAKVLLAKLKLTVLLRCYYSFYRLTRFTRGLMINLKNIYAKLDARLKVRLNFMLNFKMKRQLIYKFKSYSLINK